MNGERDDERPRARPENSDEEEGEEIFGNGAGEDEEAAHEVADEFLDFSDLHFEAERSHRG